MDRSQIHFELFVRRHARAPWVLTLASEDRGAVIEAAQAAEAASPAVGVRVCKETRDPSTGAFRPLTLLERGTRPPRKSWRPARLNPPVVAAPERPSCARPEDLYAPYARGVIGQVLEGWLARNAVTPFELLHRPDLAERLEACEAELSAAIYNAAVGEAVARGADAAAMQAALAKLVRQTIERLVHASAGGGDSPSLALGMVIAARLSNVHGWRTKVETLLALIASADRSGPAAELARRRLQQPLAEALGGNGDLEDILGVGGLGDQVLILLQIAAPPAAGAAARRDEAMRRVLPPLTGFSTRLAAELQASALLTRARRAVAARALRILASEARLWPNAPQCEVEGAQAAFALLRASARLVDMADVDAAESARWRVLTSPAFVEQRLSLSRGALEDADILLDLANAARGQAAIAELGRRLGGVLAGETFMAETRFGPDTARLRRAMLVMLRRRVAASALGAEAKSEADFLISRIANLIDADGVGLGSGPILIAHRGG